MARPTQEPLPGPGPAHPSSSRPGTLRTFAEAGIREMVMTGEVVPGQRINEVEVAGKLQISRGIVREALRTLEREGLLESVPRRGSFVRRLSPEEALEISEVRLALEVSAARTVAKGPLEEWRPHLEQRYAEIERQVEAPFAVRLRTDLSFHEAVCEASGNAELLRVWRSLMATITVMMVNVGVVETGALFAPEDHRPLLEALETPDDVEIERVWRDHFASGLTLVVEQLSDRQPE